jgi:nicotinamide riboside kinase
MFRRINLYGGAGLGKSSLASHIFSQLKQQNYRVELVQEYVKSWAYENRQISKFDQLYIFAQQLRREDIVLKANREQIVVTDSPIPMIVCYSEVYDFPNCNCLKEISKNFEEDYPSLNFFLERRDCPFDPCGRYETYEGAKEMDNRIRSFLDDNHIDYMPLGFNEWEKCLCWIYRQVFKVDMRELISESKTRYNVPDAGEASPIL